MSRCFPFPPPGYEKKPRSSSEQGEGDLLAKEKHKEKKHKKEKKDKEKRESKERKDKDRSKDKHKEKKERKEKHKDTKKDKDRDKDTNKTQEDRRTEYRSKIHNEGDLGYNSRKADEVADSKFTEELGRRIRDDEHVAADHMVEGFSSTMHRRNESMGVSTAMGKECITSNNMVTYVSSTLQRRDDKLAPSFQQKAEGLETASALEKQKVASSANVPNFTSTVRRNENLTPPVQKRTVGMGTTTIMETQRASNDQKVGDFSSAEQRNHVTCRPMENISGSVKRKTEGTLTFNSMQKELIMSNCTASSPVRAATKGNDGIVQPVESGTSSVPGRADNSSAEQRNHVTCRPMKNLSGSVKRKTEGTLTFSSMQKEMIMSNCMSSSPVRAATKGNDGMVQPVESGTSSVPGRADISAEQRNHVTCRPMENLSGLVKRKTEGTLSLNSMQKEMIMHNCTASSPVRAPTKGNDGMVQPVESGTSSVPGRADIRGVTPEMKERPLFTTILPTDQKRTGGMGLLPIEKHKLAEKDTDKKLEGNEKTKEKVTCKNLGGNEKNKEKKRKEKDKDRHREKKKDEKKRGKGEHKHSKHNKVGENGMKDLTYNLVNKIRAPHTENVKTAGADGNIKKRKELEINGFLHEPQHDGRPNKLPRTSASSSHSPMKDEMLEFRHNASPCASIKIGEINNMKVERCLDNNSNHINCKAETKPSHALGSSFHTVAVNSSKCDQVMPKLPRPPVAVESKRSDQVPSMTPHPDTKYLSTIYSIPRSEELVEFDDDQDWLFSSENHQSNPKLEADGTPPQVWANGLQIEAADVFALPYVVPF